ncbi:hypothetical protein Tco_1396462, partial [Tanacetum coccineum]
GKCNRRLNPIKTQREPTFQVVLDAFALTPCYYAFLTIADVLERYLSNLPKSTCQDFDELPIDEVIVSFFKELGHTEEIKSIIDVVVDQMHQPWITFATIINRSLSGKITGLDKLRVTPHKKVRKFKKLTSLKLTTVPASPKEPTKKSKRVKRPAKKSTNALTIGVVIRDTLGVSVSKKIAPAKADRGKGIELLSDATLLEEAQIKKTLMKSKQEHKLQASGSSEGADFESEVPDESKAKSSDTNKRTDSDDDNESDENDDEGSENNDDSGNDAQDSERTDSDEEENPNPNLNVNEEEETQEE